MLNMMKMLRLNYSAKEIPVLSEQFFLSIWDYENECNTIGYFGISCNQMNVQITKCCCVIFMYIAPHKVQHTRYNWILSSMRDS